MQVHDAAVTDDEPTPTTVRDRLTTAGLSAERIEQHMTAGRVRVDGEVVTRPGRSRTRGDAGRRLGRVSYGAVRAALGAG